MLLLSVLIEYKIFGEGFEPSNLTDRILSPAPLTKLGNPNFMFYLKRRQGKRKKPLPLVENTS